MEQYSCVIITGKGIEPIPPINNVFADMQIIFNKGGIPIRAGQGDALISNVGGKNIFNITIFDVADKARDLIGNKRVDVSLLKYDHTSVMMKNVTFQYSNNNIVFETQIINT